MESPWQTMMDHKDQITGDDGSAAVAAYGNIT